MKNDKSPYVLDSSIWIELERKNQSISELILPFIKKNQICVVDLILAEVLRGVKDEKGFRVLKKAFMEFPLIGTSWIRVSKLAFEVRANGFQPPLTDLYIAQCMIDHKKKLFTRDGDFINIQRVRKFDLEVL